MSAAPFRDLAPTVEILLGEDRLDELASVLERRTGQVERLRDWSDALALLRRIPAQTLEAHPGLAVVHARTLLNTRLEQECLEFIERVLPLLSARESEAMWVDYALVLSNRGHEAEAFEGLSAVLPRLEGALSGVALRRLGSCAYTLGKPWQGYFTESRRVLSSPPRMWGLTLSEEAYCFCQAGDYDMAQKLWLEALPCFAKDPYFQSWIHYNLGITTLRRGDFFEAHKHLTRAVEHSEQPEAQPFHGIALLGLALLRRTRGEWVRAAQLYQDALKHTTELAQIRTVEVAYLKCLRLSGDRGEALERATAACLRFPDHAPLKVAKAAVHLAWQQNTQAQAELEGLEPHTLMASARWLYALVQGELHRQSGDLGAMHAALEGVPLETLQVREETRFFPELFSELAKCRPVPEALEVTPLSIEVMAEGPVGVRVSGEAVRLPATGRAAELLLVLLEQGGQAPLNHLITALFDEHPDERSPQIRERRRKAVTAFVRELRVALGWPGSVRFERSSGIYQLDRSKEVTWVYDIDERRALNRTPRAFASGIDSNWVADLRETWGI